MTKARLIKQGEIAQQKKSDAVIQNSNPLAKNVTEVVREWVEQRRQSKPTARQAFAALFANKQMRQTV